MAKRRVPGEGSVYQRESDGRWVGVVDLGRVGGKRVRKTVTAPTLKELRPKFNRLKARVETGVLPDDMTVEQWMGHWMSAVAGEKNRPSTLRTYQTYIDNWIVPHLGATRLDRLRPDHVRTLYATMKQRGRSDATRRQVHAILRRALAVAENDGRIASNPASKVDAPAVGQGSHGKFTLPEARTILTSLEGRPDAARWAVALLEGVRQGEALGLRWADVDFDDHTLTIGRAAQRIKGQGVQVVGLKSNASYRVIPLLPPVEYALQAMEVTDGFIFGTDKPADPRRDWQSWRDMLDAAGVQRRPLHAARSTTASILSEAGVPAKIIAEILGQSQVRVTERHYIHGDSRIHLDSMRKMHELISGPV